jgi:hypothetical protein
LRANVSAKSLPNPVLAPVIKTTCFELITNLVAVARRLLASGHFLMQF